MSKRKRRCSTCHIVHNHASWTLSNTDLRDFRNKCIFALSRNAQQAAKCEFDEIEPPEPCESCALGLLGKQDCPEIHASKTCPQQNYVSYVRRASLKPYP